MSNQYNLKSIKEEFKQKGIYYTTDELALYMKTLIDVEFKNVYDPTCGDGSLLSVFDDEIEKYGQELNQHQLDVAKDRLINFKGICGDTLKEPAFSEMKFDCIMANPPFSISWEPPTQDLFNTDERFNVVEKLPPKSKADYAFILHIIHYLSNEGIAIVLNFPGILYRGNSEGEIRKWIVQNNLIEKIISIPGDKFVDTKISTVILVIKKNKKTTDIEFIDTQLNKSRIVKIDEIIKNDYQLSVSQYVNEEVVKKYINPIELQNKARQQTINKLIKDIEFDKCVCELEGFDFNEYLIELKEVISSFEK